GINDSLIDPNPIETMEEDTEVSLKFDTEKLYKNMVGAGADWLYELPQWEPIYDEEKRKELYKEQKLSTTIIKDKKIGRNDPCPCGSGKKYKKCCGK
ncbi:MAG: SEC-C metal-binding domain-containing protein, partial [Suipraeoptans sp.]